MKITIRTPQDAEELEAVYKLRYQVYVSEMGRPIVGADHQKQLIIEDIDKLAKHFIALIDGKIIGAIRVHLLKDGSFSGEEFYQAERFGPYYPNKIAFNGFLVIDNDYRNTLTAMKLTLKSYEYMRNEEIAISLMNCSPNLIRIYQFLGHRFYLENNFIYPSFQFSVIPMALVLEDIDYLKTVKSPLLKIALKFPNSNASAQFFNKEFAYLNSSKPLFIEKKSSVRSLLRHNLLHSPFVREIIASCSRKGVLFLASQVDYVNLKPGDVLYQKGDYSNALYFLIDENEKQVYKKSESLSSICGKVLGVESLAGLRRTDTVKIERPAQLFILNERALEKINLNYPKLMMKLQQLVLRELLQHA